VICMARYRIKVGNKVFEGGKEIFEEVEKELFKQAEKELRKVIS